MVELPRDSLDKFVKYATTLDGDEKSEAQVFLDRLFQGVNRLSLGIGQGRGLGR